MNYLNLTINSEVMANVKVFPQTCRFTESQTDMQKTRCRGIPFQHHRTDVLQPQQNHEALKYKYGHVMEQLHLNILLLL